jgi:hypothetical protein
MGEDHGNSTFGKNNCFTYGISAGASNCAFMGVYGTLGTPAAGNMPGSRIEASTWTDSQGNLWLYGGWGYDMNDQLQYYFNDLWEFNPSTKQWAWMGGSSTGDGSYCFSDYSLWYITCGEPGVYGVLGTPANGNGPGGRSGANSWTDSHGDLFLFGGKGFDLNGNFSDLNDLWEFNSSTKQWTWINGSQTIYFDSAKETGVYGVLGTPGAGNTPPTRWSAVSGTDKQGNFWLFGGRQTGTVGIADDGDRSAFLGDLWEYRPSTNQWAWMGGERNDQLSVIDWASGMQGTPAPRNTPGPRMAASAWIDSNGNFWFFGGYFPITFPTHPTAYGNDLWVYQPADGALPTTAVPTFSPSPGTYNGPQTVTVSDATNGATIYYTMDGSTPTLTNSSICAVCQAISIPYSKTIKAFAAASGCNDSAVVTATYTLPPQAATPTFSVSAGTYTSTQTVTISDATDGATIYYTTNGSTPTTSSSVYMGPIIVAGSETLQAIATANGHTVSLVASAMYILNLPRAATPIFSVPGGVYTTPQTVTISDATPGATIYYDTGGIPTTNSPVYSGPITISSSRGLSAIAMARDYHSSDVAVSSYTIDPSLPQAATPTFSVASGTYTATQTVTLNDTTPGVTIYYTTDGSMPARGTWIASPGSSLSISQSEILKAIAVASGYADSGVASAAYTINPFPPDFSVSASASSVSVTTGQSGTAVITVTPLSGFNSTVSFACSGLPTGSSCSFSPATVTNSGGNASTTMTVTTTSKMASGLRLFDSRAFYYGPLLTISFCLTGWKRKHRFPMRALWMLGTVTLFLLNGCGSDTSSHGSSTTPVTSTVTVTATAGSLQHTTTLSLTVN